MRRKDKPPKGVGKPDLLSVPGMEAMSDMVCKVLEVSKDEIDRRESESEAGEDPQPA